MTLQQLADEIIEELRSQTNPVNIAGMARFGIKSERCFGISIQQLRVMARRLGRNQLLAEELWQRGWRESRILATLIGEPTGISAVVMEQWVRDLDSWDVCDACCLNLFDKTPYAARKALQWSRRRREFEKRAGFATMAALAVHDRKADDAVFLPFLSAIEREATDERNFVRKAVNWALRQIGKRNRRLHRESLQTSRRIQKMDSRAARWIASHAIKELTSAAVRNRLTLGRGMGVATEGSIHQ